MKRCPYCGADYPDDAVECSTDAQPLEWVGERPQTESETLAPEPVPIPEKDTSKLTFPEYQWKAIDGWKCLGTLVVVGLLFEMSLSILFYQFRWFRQLEGTGYGYFAECVLRYSLELLVAAYFARTETLATLFKGFGLDRKPTNYVWLGVTLAVALQFVGHILSSHGWHNGVRYYDINAAKHTEGFERLFFLAPLIFLAPVFEESMYRGFLYKAFRGSYPIQASLLIIVAWTACIHTAQYASVLGASTITALTLVQCYLREKSDSLWDCILCHFAFNTSGLFIYGTFKYMN